MLVDGFSQLEYLQKEGILKIGQATVLANGSICGVNTERFCKNEAVRNKIRNELNISEDSVVFIFLGRLKREKGIYELFEAFNDIISTCYNAKLLLVGADEENCIASLHKYKNLKINDNVVYYGATPKPEELYNAADIYVLPTYREGFGLSILEASSVGLPVITTDTYGVRDSIVEGTTGLRCKTQDVKSLSECMTVLYGDKEQREKLGQNGVNYVQEKFTIQTVCEAWLNYYLNVVK
jgi:glycosyltransferase involved in cell wall biosynthesis